MASGFELRVAAANAKSAIEWCRGYVGPNEDDVEAEADSAAFRRVEAYLDGIIEEREFQDGAIVHDVLIRHMIVNEIAKHDARRWRPIPAGNEPSSAAPADAEAQAPAAPLHCSFCGVSGDYATTLVAGLATDAGGAQALICDGCVKLATDIVDGRRDQHPLSRAQNSGVT